MSAPATIDLLIKARWIVPIIPENQIFKDCALAIHKGVILALLPQEEADKRYAPRQALNLGDHVLIPGLVNAHGHAGMSLLRGYADDLPLMTWLNEHIWPAEGQWASDQMVRDGTELAMAEMIKSGTTCFTDTYYFPEQAAQAAQQAHMRASSLVRIGFGPHAPYTVSNSALERIAVLSQEMDAPVHIHLHETAQEVADSEKEYGQRPIERLHELGLMSPLTQCVHMTQVSDTDMELLQETGAHVIHCPQSNLKLATGFCPVQQLIDAGINVALGTDGAASNNDLDMFSEMQSAALLAKGVSGRPDALNAHRALRMATLDSAKALGLEDTIGSLEVGKAADVTAVELSALDAQPLYNPASQLVYTQSGHRVSHVWVGGKALLLSRQLQTLNERELIGKARWWRKQIGQQA